LSSGHLNAGAVGFEGPSAEVWLAGSMVGLATVFEPGASVSDPGEADVSVAEPGLLVSGDDVSGEDVGEAVVVVVS
jgi:hypothetical protein